MANNYLGIDYGLKRIGLAIGSDETKIAVVFGTVHDIDDIIKVIKEEKINVIVLGQPFSVASAAHALPVNFQNFVEELTVKLPSDVVIHYEDERLSSKYADSLAGDKKTKANRDEIAAVSILQGYFDKN